jgi:hypothetical protein
MNVSRSLALLAMCATNAIAQSRGELFGTVRDSLGRPIEGASVNLIAARRATTTDSLGRYRFASLGNGNYTVMARKLGWAPETWDAKLSDGGRLEINFTLRRRTDLDTIRVVGKATCEGLGVLGFECRREIAEKRNAIFLDYPDIDNLGWRYARDMRYWALKERERWWKDRSLPFVPSSRRCLNEFVDGRPIGPANPLPKLAIDIVSIEMYPHTDSVPTTHKDWLWATGTTMDRPLRIKRCGVVLYWTIWAPLGKPMNRVQIADNQMSWSR